MIPLQFTAACLFLAVISEAVDPRLLRGNTQPTVASDPDALARQYQSLLSQFNALATDLRHAKNTIEELQRRDDQHARTISAIEERLGRGCRCSGPGGDNTNENEQDRNEIDLDGWVVTLSREKVRNIRRNFSNPSIELANRNRDEEDARAVRMGKAFASVMVGSRVIENKHGDSTIRQTTALPTIEEQDPRQPSRVRPNPFPFGRPGRSLQLRHRREVTENEAFTEFEETFTDLVRANKKCAFSAIRTMPLFGNGDPQVVTFQKTQANKGKSFDSETGAFIASIPGIYYFSYTMRTYDYKHIGVALMLNDDPVVAMTTDASDRKVMQTQSAMLHLEIGDQVWLLLGPSEYFALYGNDFNYNTFNGLLLYPNYIK